MNTMSNKYEILGKYIKDLSSETPDIETYLYVRDRISSYKLDIDISSKALKNKMIEIFTTFKFLDKEGNKKKSYFEIVYSTVIRVNEEVKERRDLEKIILVDVQNQIYPDLEKALLNLLHDSGYPGIKFEKKVDFENLYSKKFN